MNALSEGTYLEHIEFYSIEWDSAGLSPTYGGKGHLLPCAVRHLVMVIATKTQRFSGYFPADQSLSSMRSV
jgi:hypothetical protein